MNAQVAFMVFIHSLIYIFVSVTELTQNSAPADVKVRSYDHCWGQQLIKVFCFKDFTTVYVQNFLVTFRVAKICLGSFGIGLSIPVGGPSNCVMLFRQWDIFIALITEFDCLPIFQALQNRMGRLYLITVRYNFLIVSGNISVFIYILKSPV